MLTAASYLRNIDRFFLPVYLPNDQDVLRTYIQTLGTAGTRFELDGFDYSVIDSEPRRCLHHLGGAHCLIFVTSMDEYDKPVLDPSDPETVRGSLRSSLRNLSQNSLLTSWFSRS